MFEGLNSLGELWEVSERKKLILILVIPCDGEPYTWLVSSLQLFLCALDFDLNKVIEYFQKAGFDNPSSNEKLATVRSLTVFRPPLLCPCSSTRALTSL